MAKKKEDVKPEVITAKVIGNLPLNIRAEKTTESAIVGKLKPGTEVEILKAGKQWCQIEGGYLMRKYLEF